MTFKKNYINKLILLFIVLTNLNYATETNLDEHKILQPPNKMIKVYPYSYGNGFWSILSGTKVEI